MIDFRPSARSLHLGDQPWQGDELTRLVQLWCVQLVLECGAYRAAEASRFEDLYEALCQAMEVRPDPEPHSLSELMETLAALRLRLLDKGDTPPERCLPLVASLGERIGLSFEETRVLALLCVCALVPRFAHFLDGREGGGNPIELRALLAHLSDLPVTAVSRVLAYEGTLVRMGLVEGGDDSMFRSRPQHRVDERLIDLLQAGRSDPEEYLRCHFNAPGPSTLGLADYAHLGHRLEGWVTILRDAIRKGRTGFNILVHGRPGVGKTELSRVLAQACEAELMQVAGKGLSGMPVSRLRMLNDIRMAQRVLGRERPTLLLVDEADALLPRSEAMETTVEFAGGVRPASMKAWLIELLETNRLPTLWVANDVYGVHPALLRRFQLVMEIEIPPRAARLRIIERAFGDTLVGDDLKQRMAALDDLVPATVASLASNARCLQGSGLPVDAFVEDQLQQARQVQGLAPLPAHRTLPLGRHALEWLNASQPLEPLTDIARHPGGLKLCAHGRPGTGKTAFAYVLADKLQRPLRKITAADLLSRWVGGTERRIQAAFRDASVEGAVLLIDEVESLLADRSSLERSWERSQVNALLTAIDEYEGVLVLTTNHPGQMDPAVARRLDYSIEFKPLGRSQLDSLWRSLASRYDWGDEGEALASQALDLAGLTLGDVAQSVKRLKTADTSPPRAFAVLVALRQARGERGRTWRHSV